ncbi:hypothetical protein Scep_017733 [Stephania cephalantha]|uniref:Transposase, Ptta/En/Spm, plant n=1 Tax=Stephania cephalantha TaxID=152367 RepID=A0AAP0IR04_9MAGN
MGCRIHDELGIICLTYAPIRVARWKKVEQKDKEQIYNLISEDDGESVGPIEFWKKTHYTEKGWKTPMAQQLYEEMIEIQSQPSPMTEDEIYKEVMDKKSGYARGRGYGEIGSSSSIAKRIRVEELQEAREKTTNAEKIASELAQHVETQKIELTETSLEVLRKSSMGSLGEEICREDLAPSPPPAPPAVACLRRNLDGVHPS